MYIDQLKAIITIESMVTVAIGLSRCNHRAQRCFSLIKMPEFHRYRGNHSDYFLIVAGWLATKMLN